MVALISIHRPWRDPADAPMDGTSIEAEDEDNERVIVEWHAETGRWIIGRKEDGTVIWLTKSMVRWRHKI